MAVFNEPSKWQTSLVNSGDANTIPQSTPAGTGEASFEDGFPQITQVPIGAGGIAPDRKDFNGLFKILGDWIFFAQNGGLASYNPAYDYVVGRYVVYNNTLYKCIQANGASSTVVAPDSVSPLGSDYWVQVATLADFTNKADKDFTNIDNTAKIAIAHNSMPSDVYDDLTLGASSTTYTAPADGYFALSISASTGGTVQMDNITEHYDISMTNPNIFGFSFIFPVRKDAQVQVNYPTNTNVYSFKFIYAVGSKSEQGV